MEEKKFVKVIAAIAFIGLASAVALAIYTLILFGDLSIITFIANGR